MGRTLGADLGTFHVTAAAETNECGPGALGSSERFEFEVDLARADTELFWDENVGGRLGPELDFELAARVIVELRSARLEDAGCSVLREDLVSGRLEPDTRGEVTSFTGTMRFDFAETAGSTCTGAEQDAARLPRLPCRMSYDLIGHRTRAPEP